MYENLKGRLEELAKIELHDDGMGVYRISEEGVEIIKGLAYEASNAIEDLNRQRDRAYARLCEWCGVCPEGKRNAEDCEIAALNPEPPKEETPTGPYDLLYEEGGPDA